MRPSALAQPHQKYSTLLLSPCINIRRCTFTMDSLYVKASLLKRGPNPFAFPGLLSSVATRVTKAETWGAPCELFVHLLRSSESIHPGSSYSSGTEMQTK